MKENVSLNYVLMVNAPVYGRQTALTAYRFAQALIAQGHRLSRVFFYQEGVSNSLSSVLPANDEFNLAEHWQALAQEHQIELATCVSAGLRRGVVGEEEATVHQLASPTMAQDFLQVGLGSLAEALITADRVVQF